MTSVARFGGETGSLGRVAAEDKRRGDQLEDGVEISVVRSERALQALEALLARRHTDLDRGVARS